MTLLSLYDVSQQDSHVPTCQGHTDSRNSLVDAITYEKAMDPSSAVTASAVLGPFFRHDHPIREKGASIHITRAPDGVDVYLFGRVTDGRTGEPLTNATVDVWQASTNGG